MRLPIGVPVDPDPAAEFEALRGSITAERIPPGGRIFRPGKRDKAVQDVELVTIPGASKFTEDDALCEPDALLRELLLQPGRHVEGSPELTSLSELREQIEPRYERGRRRGEGDWYALYLHMLACGGRNPHEYWLRHASRGAPICGFRRRPSRGLVEDRFAELEEHWELVASRVDEKVALGCEIVPQMREVVAVDSTAWRAPARFKHCCTDDDACRAAGAAADLNLRPEIAQKLIKAGRKLEAELPEEDVELGRGTRQPVVLVDDENKREPQLYRLFFINGHWYRSLDTTSGFRKLANGAMWHGGYDQFAISPVVWLPLAAHCFPCDIAEMDGYPYLFERLVAATGAPPHVVSADRGFAFSAFFEYNIRRSVAVVAPRRRLPGMTSPLARRRQEFDEDGIPRCEHCFGPGVIDAPGLGLSRRGRDPRIAFVCAAPFFHECEGQQLIDPSLHYPSIVPLSRLTLLYHAVRYWHHPSEGVHRRIRWNYRAAGNDIGSSASRRGVPAQRLLMYAGLDLAWSRLLLRQGWSPARDLRVAINETRLVRLSGIQDRATGLIVEPGDGAAALATLNARRAANDTNYPYGDAWLQLQRRVAEELGLRQEDIDG